MSKTTKTGRAAALFLALLFLASTIGAVLLVVKQSSDNQALSDVQQQLAEQQANQETCKVSNPEPASVNKPGDPLVLSSPVTDLQVNDTVVGSGAEVQLNDCVTVNYRLSLADGSIVDGNDTFAAGEPVAFQLVEGGLIEGWIKGLPGAKVGGLRQLVVPAALAYGDQSQGGVPANADLVFEIEILDTKH